MTEIIKNSLTSLDVDAIRRQKAESAKVRDSIGNVVNQATPASVPAEDGIASPLVEKSRETVDFDVYDDFNVWFVTEQHVVSLVMEDANGSQVEFKFVDPNTGQVPT